MGHYGSTASTARSAVCAEYTLDSFKYFLFYKFVYCIQHCILSADRACCQLTESLHLQSQHRTMFHHSRSPLLNLHPAVSLYDLTALLTRLTCCVIGLICLFAYFFQFCTKPLSVRKFDAVGVKLAKSRENTSGATLCQGNCTYFLTELFSYLVNWVAL